MLPVPSGLLRAVMRGTSPAGTRSRTAVVPPCSGWLVPGRACHECGPWTGPPQGQFRRRRPALSGASCSGRAERRTTGACRMAFAHASSMFVPSCAGRDFGGAGFAVTLAWELQRTGLDRPVAVAATDPYRDGSAQPSPARLQVQPRQDQAGQFLTRGLHKVQMLPG